MWLVIISIMIGPLMLHAEESFYHVYDIQSGLDEHFEDYQSAYSFYKENTENYEGLVLKEDDRVIMMEYGIVVFKTDGACSLFHEYHSASRNETDYVNGCYGIDAVYIDTSRNGKQVTFMIGGDMGVIDIEDVILIPLEEVSFRLSSYTVKDGILQHDIMKQSDIDFFSESIVLGKAPQGLKRSAVYYSSDGHYFYDDMHLLIDDLRADSHENAVNETAYYNYFQYLPYRSYTQYSLSELERYFYETLKIDGRLDHYDDLNFDEAADEINRSQLYGTIASFYACQDLYGANALMLLGSAVNESAYGRSRNSYESNNLFFLSVYENDLQRENDRYDSIDDSIYAHARYYVSGRLGKHLRDDYEGTFFGSKLSGINVTYTMDPYYGERSAAACRRLDSMMGGKDLDHYAIGIIKDKNRLVFYEDEAAEGWLYSIRNINEFALIILDVTEDMYKVRIDDSFSEDDRYDPRGSYAYIYKEDVDLVLNEDRINEETFAEKHYQMFEGDYHDEDEFDVISMMEDQFMPDTGIDGYEFTGFDEDGNASYRKITSVEVKGEFRKTDLIDLRDVNLHVVYEDGEEKQIPVNSDMFFCDGENAVIRYHGFEQTCQVKQNDQLLQTFTKAIENGDSQFIKGHVSKIEYPFTVSDIRKIDQQLKQGNERNYVIIDKTESHDISISGLDLSLPDKKSLTLTRDTYYVIVGQIDPLSEEKIYDLAKAYGFEKTDGLDISFRFNYQSIGLTGPIVIQTDIGNKRSDRIYSVYHLEKDGDIVKCRTSQSDHYIQFIARGSGPYLIMSLDSVNEYDIQDGVENLSYANMGSDQHKMNLQILTALVMSLTGLIGITVYNIINNKRKKLWRDFRRSLREAGTVQEEKPKN